MGLRRCRSSHSVRDCVIENLLCVAQNDLWHTEYLLFHLIIVLC